MVEAGGIREGGRATSGEDMDDSMADCGARGIRRHGSRSGGGGRDMR